MLPSDAIPIKKNSLPQDAVRINKIPKDVLPAEDKPQNLIQSLVSRITSQKTKPISLSPSDNPLMVGGKLALSVAGVPEEDLYPMLGQTVGGYLGGKTGIPAMGFGGAVGGATLGQTARQGIRKAIRGEELNPSEIIKEAGVTGLIEGITRGSGKFIFRRQIANDLLGNLGKKLGEMKNAIIANPNLSIPSEEIYLPLKESMEKVAVPHGQQAGIINKWLKFMEKNPKLSGQNLIEMEKDLGEIAEFGQIKKGVFIQPSIKKPALNRIAKDTRSQVSSIVDDMAEQSGQKGFKETSKKISKLLSNPRKTDVTKTTGGFLNPILNALGLGALTQNPGMGVGAYFATQAVQSPELRNAAYKLAKNPVARAVGTGMKLSLSELARRKN